ncbi:hypothetical protein SAMN04487911_1331 [Arenibacter nanhaiticus]|uniref:Uncharacterized protein n=1 Tax=Arenibacter nanhaiticus TaxID=558155 RepID=A0A1M6LPA5_9FLAO|nr:hypothetical protein SAMN04487911_1331 [Arenibacter nanhaiticus]
MRLQMYLFILDTTRFSQTFFHFFSTPDTQPLSDRYLRVFASVFFLSVQSLLA